jgi:hypothetical protein
MSNKRSNRPTLWLGRKPIPEVQAFLEEQYRLGNIKPGFTQVWISHDTDCRYPQGSGLCICDGGPEIQIGGNQPKGTH